MDYTAASFENSNADWTDLDGCAEPLTSQKSLRARNPVLDVRLVDSNASTTPPYHNKNQSTPDVKEQQVLADPHPGEPNLTQRANMGA